ATRWLLRNPRDREELLLTSLAIAASYVAAAFPLQADAPWVAVGWAAEAAVLWWFGLRLRTAPLRMMAAVLSVMAVVKLIFYDTPAEVRPPFVLILNTYALPALSVAALLTIAVILTGRFRDRLPEGEKPLLAIAAVGCVVLYWFIISIDLYQ